MHPLAHVPSVSNINTEAGASERSVEIYSDSKKKGPNLCAVAEPPEIGKGPQLTGPHDCTDVDLLIPDGDEGNSEMDMLHRTCRNKESNVSV